MTSDEWLKTTDVLTLLSYVMSDERLIESGPYEGLTESGRLVGDRELRFFACACARELYKPLHRDRAAAIAVAEKEADNYMRSPGWYERLLTARRSIDAVSGWIWCATCPDIAVGLRQTVFHDRERPSPAIQLSLFRSILGNPFLRPAIDLNWLTPQVKSIAESCYQERMIRRCQKCNGTGRVVIVPVTYCDPSCRVNCRECDGIGVPESGRLNPDTLAVLADALQDVGCGDESILQHLRGKERCIHHPTSDLSKYKGRWHSSTTEMWPIDPFLCDKCGKYGNEEPGWQTRVAGVYRGDLIIDLLTGRRMYG